MGIEYALVNDDEKTFIRLGKRIYASKEGGDSDGKKHSIDYLGYQIHDEKIARFLSRSFRGAFRLIPDTGEEYGELYEKNYTMVDEWCGDFASRRVRP